MVRDPNMFFLVRTHAWLAPHHVLGAVSPQPSEIRCTL